jgi:nicotinamide phosphoribosyltransferase
VESAALGGAAHLVNFLGTDTVAALLCCRRYYHATKAENKTNLTNIN